MAGKGNQVDVKTQHCVDINQGHVGFLRQSVFNFLKNFRICPMLKVDVKPALSFDVNLIFISNINDPTLESNELNAAVTLT